MQYLGLGTVVAFLIACGPPPENSPVYSQTSGGSVVESSGGTVTGGSPAPSGGLGAGGAVAKGGNTTASGGSAAGGYNPFGNNGGAKGGSVPPMGGGGGSLFDGGVSKGGSFGMGGIPVISPKGTPLSIYYFPVAEEPCAAPRDVTLKTDSFETTAGVCYRTVDDIAGWGCSNVDGRTVKVNGVEVKCATMPLPAKKGSFYYFDVSAGGVPYGSLYWYGSEHPVPECGYFPTWQSGGSAKACTGPPPVDAAAPLPPTTTAIDAALPLPDASVGH